MMDFSHGDDPAHRFQTGSLGPGEPLVVSSCQASQLIIDHCWTASVLCIWPLLDLCLIMGGVLYW